MKKYLIFAAFIFAACSPYVSTPPAATSPATVQPTVTATEQPKATATPKQTAHVTALSALNVRVRPGEQSAAVGALYHNNAVTLTQKCHKGWAEIVWKQATAWVKAKYLSDNKCQAKP